MNLPPFVYSLAFWKALSYALAGVLALLVYFGVIGPEWALSAGALLALFLTVLEWIGITPELRLRAEVKALKTELGVLRTLLPDGKPYMVKKNK